jgi:hypothetical protein
MLPKMRKLQEAKSLCLVTGICCVGWHTVEFACKWNVYLCLTAWKRK